MYSRLFDVDLTEIFSRSRVEVGEIFDKQDYSIFDDFEKASSAARIEVGKIFERSKNDRKYNSFQ